VTIVEHLENALSTCTTRATFDAWVQANAAELSDYFHSATGQSLNDSKFDNWFYKIVAPSAVFREYRRTKNLTEDFEFFLYVMALAAEKMAQVGLPSFAGMLVEDLPESPSKFRLRALLEFATVDDLKKGYLNKFPAVLEHLQNSVSASEETNARLLIDTLIFFHNSAKKKLLQRGLMSIYNRVKGLYESPDLIAQYTFLDHAVLQALTSGQDPFGLLLRPSPRKVLTPSAEIGRLFREINRQFLSHSKIDFDADSVFGFSTQKILDDVIVHGRTDFTMGYRTITPDEKVLLYCFFNMKMHFFSSYEVFNFVYESLAGVFSNADYPPLFVDLGCGPMTSGLALADILSERTGRPARLKYVGIDIAPAMLRRAQTFEKAAIFSRECTFSYGNNWRELTPTVLSKLAGPHTPILFNASYLFASSSLDPIDLAQFVRETRKRYENVYFIFQNPDNVARNRKYEEFKSHLSYSEILSDVQEVQYLPSGRKVKSQWVYFEILKIA